MFIVVEGLDGAGKTTLLQGLMSHLTQLGRVVNMVREPGGSPPAEVVRHVLKDPQYEGQIPSIAELLLFYASRAMAVETVVKPMLARGEIVLGDRFELSTFAYQGYGLGLLREAVDISELTLQGFKPDVYLFVDAPAEVCLERRLAASGATDSIESRGLEYFKRCQVGFQSGAAFVTTPIITLDGTLSPEALLNQAIRELHPFFMESEPDE